MTSTVVPFMSDELIVSQPFTGYCLEEVIGKSQNGAVYKARDDRFGRTAALKCMRISSTAAKEVAETFFAEAKQFAKVKHPQIARGIDVGKVGQLYYLAYEFTRGETVKARLERLERKRFTERTALTIVLSVADALNILFRANLTHRRIHPRHILCTDTKNVQLLESGFAYEISEESNKSLLQGMIHYISPERIQMREDADIRSDLYALGCVWYEMVSGSPPFSGSNELEILMQKHLEAMPDDLQEKKISAATSVLINWLLEKDRDRRPRTPAAFLNKLQQHPLLDADTEPMVTDPNADLLAGLDEPDADDESNEY